MVPKETVQAYSGRACLLLVDLERVGQTFTNVVQALCFIQVLDMQCFVPFYMSYITSSRSINSSSLASIKREASSFFSAHSGWLLLTLSSQGSHEVPHESLLSSYPWYGMMGKSSSLALALYKMFKCPVCCFDAHLLAKCPPYPEKKGGGGGGGGGDRGGNSRKEKENDGWRGGGWRSLLRQCLAMGRQGLL